MKHRLGRGAAALAAVAVLSVALSACSRDDEPSAEPSSAAATTNAADALVETGLAQVQSGQVEAAAGTFANVLALDPDNVAALYNLGYLAQVSDGDTQAALGYYDQALAVDDAYVPALYNKAILTEPDDLRAATDLYRRVIEADDTAANAYMRLGFALVHLGDTEEGEEYLGQGITLDPSMAEVDAPSYE